MDEAVVSLLKTSVPLETCKAPKADGAPKVLSIGLWAIADDKSPVGSVATKRIYSEIVSRLIKFKPKCVDVIDSAGIGIIADHLSKTGALDAEGGNVLAALSDAHQRVDIVAFADLTSQSGKVFLSLRTVERVSGKTLGLTKSVPIPLALTASTANDSAMSLDEAIKAAGAALLQSAKDMNELQEDGIFYAGTQAQPPAARFIQEKILSTLIEQSSNPMTGKVIKTRGIKIETYDNIQTSAADLEIDTIAKRNDIHSLSGRYWIIDQAIDLKLTLKAPNGETSSWNGRIRLADLKQLELRPSNPASSQIPLPKANYAFQVTTPRGSAPIYRKGEELNLLVRVARAAWMYCFYVDSRGGVETIYPLPPRFFAGRTNRIEAKRLVRIPDPVLDRFKFRVTDNTVGEELVSCFTTLKNVTSELPASLFPDNVSNIPFLTLDQVRQIFANLRGAQVAEGLVTITITQ